MPNSLNDNITTSLAVVSYRKTIETSEDPFQNKFAQIIIKRILSLEFL